MAALTAAAAAVLAAAAAAAEGGLVLQFDDGWSSWRELIAPELAAVGGKATGFVNNQYLHAGRITLADLQCLQNDYGWEIGTHAYSHVNALQHVRRSSVQDWVDTQLLRSMRELSAGDLRVRNLAFPYNAATPELRAAVLQHVDSYRAADTLALAAGPRLDGSLPGTSIDLTRFTPLPLLQQWIDLARAERKRLFLYGHRVLPDDQFFTGRVLRVDADLIVADRPITPPPGDDLVLVPDVDRRSRGESPSRLVITGDVVRAPGVDLASRTAHGATFLIGPAYGTRLSDFRRLVTYAAGRVTFQTVGEIVLRRDGGAARMEADGAEGERPWAGAAASGAPP